MGFSAFMDTAKKGLKKSAERVSAFAAGSPKTSGAKKIKKVSLKKKYPKEFRNYLMDDASDDKSFPEYLKGKNIGI